MLSFVYGAILRVVGGQNANGLSLTITARFNFGYELATTVCAFIGERKLQFSDEKKRHRRRAGRHHCMFEALAA